MLLDLRVFMMSSWLASPYCLVRFSDMLCLPKPSLWNTPSSLALEVLREWERKRKRLNHSTVSSPWPCSNNRGSFDKQRKGHGLNYSRKIVKRVDARNRNKNNRHFNKYITKLSKLSTFTYLSGSSWSQRGCGGVSTANPMSSWELDEDWSDSWVGRTCGLSSSIMTMSSWGMFTVGESW